MRRDRCAYDVVVVGARVAGAATAMLLARQGLNVLVVDRSRYGADALSTHALMRAGVLQLTRWGLLDRIVRAGTPAIRRTTFTYAHERVVISLKPSYGVDALYAPRRTVLDPVLVDAARNAGADVRYSVATTGIRRDSAGRVAGVTIRDDRGDAQEVDARLVIGADGVRSTVARSVGAPIARRGSGVSSAVYGYWSDVDVDGYEWAFRRNALAGIVPTNDGQACVFAGSTPDRVGAGGIQVLRDILQAADGNLAARVAAARAPDGVRAFAGLPGFVRRSWGPGWALVGDAGSWKDPLSAHGLTDALRDAELLARAVSGVVGDPSALDAALASYQATRDALSDTLFTTVDTIAMQRWTDDEISGLLLQLSSAMTDEVEALAALDLPDMTAFPNMEMTR